MDKIVVHWTVGSLESSIAEFQRPFSEKSAHYIIDRDGLLYQCVSEDDTAWHANDFPINLRSIGIEHVGGPQYNGFTNEQYATSADVCAELGQRYGFPIDELHVQGHREFSATQCPGVLDIPRIVGGTMTDVQMAELKAYIDAKFSEFYGADAATKRRMMRGADPYLPGHDTTITAGDKIYQTEAL